MSKARSPSQFERLCRLAGWLLLAIITVLSVVPPGYRPVTPAPHDVEHMSIFVPAGLAFGLGYERGRLVQVIALITFSAVIEASQLVIPGRHARLSDFIVNALSISIGVGMAALIAGCARLAK
jgi:VanZ family protein